MDFCREAFTTLQARVQTLLAEAQATQRRDPARYVSGRVFLLVKRMLGFAPPPRPASPPASPTGGAGAGAGAGVGGGGGAGAGETAAGRQSPPRREERKGDEGLAVAGGGGRASPARSPLRQRKPVGHV